jgi:hypothetical protein
MRMMFEAVPPDTFSFSHAAGDGRAAVAQINGPSPLPAMRPGILGIANIIIE